MAEVTICSRIPAERLADLLDSYGMHIQWINHDQPIPGSHFGEPEAGLIADKLYARKNTPVHSVLHEACHYICMDEERRSHLHTDVGGDYNEENAVCYLSILLADDIPGYSASQMMLDMDNWGYTFRLGSARRWFEEDAEDALNWLLAFNLINKQQSPTGELRI